MSALDALAAAAARAEERSARSPSAFLARCDAGQRASRAASGRWRDGSHGQRGCAQSKRSAA